MAARTGVYILAANRLLREALGRTFKSRTDIEVIGSSEQASLEKETIIAARPDVLLIDGGTQDIDWTELIPELRSKLPDMRTVIFGMQEDIETFFRAVRLGVAGYLLSEASASDLVAAVRAAARDEAICPPRLCMALFRYVHREPSMPSSRLRARHGLTRREQQLIPLIAQGLTNKEIATHLCLSEQTVKNHVHRILRKVGSGDRLSAIAVLDVNRWQA